jgi:putative DNA primase/helicase
MMRLPTSSRGELGRVAYIPGEGFRQYRDGSWPLVPDRDIDRMAKARLVCRLGPKQQVRTYLQGVRQCLELNVERREFGRATRSRIGLLNAVFDLATAQFEGHSPDHELRFRLDIPYEPAAECPIYLDQLEQTFAGDNRAANVFEEFAGLTLVPDMRFQRALYLLGSAGSGKSTLLRVLESMHDPEAVAVTSLDKIDHERYLTDLATKLVCISYDVQTNRSVFGEAFVRITGGDPVAIRKLYHEVEGRVTPTVRFVGSMNFDIPKSVAASDALRRRLIFLLCGAKVDRPDPDRFEKLRAERPGILIRWMAAVRRLYARGEFDIPPESLDEVVDYTTAQDPVVFAKESLEADPNALTLISEITRAYNWWADEREERRLTANTLGRKLRSLGFKGGFTSISEDGDRRSCRVIQARLGGAPRPTY